MIEKYRNRLKEIIEMSFRSSIKIWNSKTELKVKPKN